MTNHFSRLSNWWDSRSERSSESPSWAWEEQLHFLRCDVGFLVGARPSLSLPPSLAPSTSRQNLPAAATTPRRQNGGCRHVGDTVSVGVCEWASGRATQAVPLHVRSLNVRSSVWVITMTHICCQWQQLAVWEQFTHVRTLAVQFSLPRKSGMFIMRYFTKSCGYLTSCAIITGVKKGAVWYN